MQPESIHGHHGLSPVVIATAVIVVPILLAVVVGAVAISKLGNTNGGATSGVIVPSALAASPLLLKYEVQNASERGAVCDDGSPATYYYRPGAAGVTEWIIFLEGGGSCTTTEECAWRAAREPHRVSSLNYPGAMAFNGLLSADERQNPDYHNLHHVYVKYCSSDSWSNNEGPEIIQAVIEDLPLAGSTEIIFTGAAEGQTGADFNRPLVQSMLPDVTVRPL